MKVQFSFQVRQAMTVATAVAEEVENNSQLEKKFCEKRYELRPVLLSVSGMTFRFEGGTVVKVHLVDLNEERTKLPQEWVVTHVEIRYRTLSLYDGDQISETWGADKLDRLKEIRPWYHPNVKDVDTITGVIGIFADSANSEGFIRVNPSYVQDGRYFMFDSVPYRKLVPGDLGRAKAEAIKKLSEFFAQLPEQLSE